MEEQKKHDESKDKNQKNINDKKNSINKKDSNDINSMQDKNKNVEDNHQEEIKKEKIKNNNETPKKKSKLRMILVLIFLIIFAVGCYVSFKGSYLEYQELGDNYIDVFYNNLKFKYIIMGVNFVILYFVIYMTNRGIKKGLTDFFAREKKKIPKLLNKSLALVFSAVISVFIAETFTNRIILLMSNASFGKTDPIFNLDISYYVFQKPIIEMLIIYFIALVVGLSIYMALYYIIVFNKCFDGIDGKMLKQSDLLKKVKRNVILIGAGVACYILVGTQNILYGDITKVNDDITIVGAGFTEATVRLWGYVIFAIIVFISIYKAVKGFDEGSLKKTLIRIAVIPGYLVALFLVMLIFDLIFVNPNELDKEKDYLSYNIENTKTAYNIDIDESNIDNSGTITDEQISSNSDTINNIPIVSYDCMLKTLKDSQTATGYYSFPNTNIAKYLIDGKEQLVYVSPREISSTGRTYNNKTYEYTHGMGLIFASATTVSSTGTINYIQKSVSGNDSKINITEPQMYFGLQPNQTVATNTKNKAEYDYTDESGTDHTSTYQGNAGLKVGFLDRLILGITKGDINLAFSGEITDDSKILINRNIIERAKKALPNLIYDNDPYTVVRDDGSVVWVLDAYTVSSSYPYSQYSSIEHDGIKEKINYIRNSVKVIVDAYDGTMKFYITDRTDPIAMAYRNAYPTLFEDLDEEIPQDIQKHIVYPMFLYNIQAQMLATYHNVKPEVLYRGDDLWDIAKYNSTNSTKSTGTSMAPYYTEVKTNDDSSKLGLVQIYSPLDKQNLISYLVGKTDGATNKLKLYKFSADSNVVGPMQLDKQIAEDTTISSELTALSTTGSKITKEMLVVPIDNTLIYVEPIYQTLLNESEVPILKKVVVASGNKVAIGDNINSALSNLLSKYAVDIEVENTDDINGLIDLIIKANNNLTKSNESNDWEMMGKDTKKLQELITSLDKLKQEEEKKKEDAKYQNKTNATSNEVNTTNSSNVAVDLNVAN